MCYYDMSAWVSACVHSIYSLGTLANSIVDKSCEMNMHKICANINYGSLNKGDSKCNLFGLLFFLAICIKPTGGRRGKTWKCCSASTEGQMRQKSRKVDWLWKWQQKRKKKVATAQLAINL